MKQTLKPPVICRELSANKIKNESAVSAPFRLVSECPVFLPEKARKFLVPNESRAAPQLLTRRASGHEAKDNDDESGYGAATLVCVGRGLDPALFAIHQGMDAAGEKPTERPSGTVVTGLMSHERVGLQELMHV